MPPSRSSLLRQLPGAGLFLALSIVSVIIFLKLFPPRQPLGRLRSFEGVDRSPVRAALSAENVARLQADILKLGSRFLGQEGFYKTERYLRDRLKSAGLEVLEQTIQTPSPRTLCRRIVDDQGRDLSGAEIYPFFPNHFQPMNTGAAGVTGRLLLVSDDVLLWRGRFDDCIAVIDAENPPRNFALNWTKYAQLGFRAVILAHRKGLANIGWQDTGGMWSSIPVNFIRLAANEAIFDHLDQSVTLHVRTQYANTDNTTLIGILRCRADGKPADEAVVISGSYDAFSVLPDAAPGAIPAVSVATQLALLDGLTKYRGRLNRDVLFVFAGSQVMANDAINRLASTLGSRVDADNARIRIQNDVNDNQRALAKVKAILAAFDSAEFLIDEPATARALG